MWSNVGSMDGALGTGVRVQANYGLFEDRGLGLRGWGFGFQAERVHRFSWFKDRLGFLIACYSEDENLQCRLSSSGGIRSTPDRKSRESKAI